MYLVVARCLGHLNICVVPAACLSLHCDYSHDLFNYCV